MEIRKNWRVTKKITWYRIHREKHVFTLPIFTWVAQHTIEGGNGNVLGLKIIRPDITLEESRQ